MSMRSSVVSKRATQEVIRDLRKAGYTVDKIDGGYSCDYNGELVFKAMAGMNGYLCRFNKSVFND